MSSYDNLFCLGNPNCGQTTFRKILSYKGHSGLPGRYLIRNGYVYRRTIPYRQLHTSCAFLEINPKKYNTYYFKENKFMLLLKAFNVVLATLDPYIYIYMNKWYKPDIRHVIVWCVSRADNAIKYYTAFVDEYLVNKTACLKINSHYPVS